MVEPLSPLQPVWAPGSHGNVEAGIGVTLSETHPASIVQVTAWPGQEKAMIAAIKAATKVNLPDGAGGGIATSTKAAFGIAPGKFLIVHFDEQIAETLAKAVTVDTGTVTDLSHGRTAIRIAGPKVEWVLAKFFAIDFALPAFPVGTGRSTNHHDIFAQIQRTGAEQFDLYVFRSFARSFWKALCHASDEVGYEVA